MKGSRIADALVILMLAGCQAAGPGCSDKEAGTVEAWTIAEVIRDRAAELMAIPGVTGVAEGRTADDRVCLVIYVHTLTPALERDLPREVAGFPVVVEESGEIRPLGKG
ncbi:MAG: hypothetical protein ABIK96_04545 [bacterium]